ncbi:putative methyltransferase-domain-containing protein [Phyllosticta paracitricarpa]|uniref:Protein-lysine N-methyltransferase EFM6 n=1 Tax=Phyllosticta paracitricarpa TaxID=2016321 RepID=A0ABR1MYX5_9PEZI
MSTSPRKTAPAAVAAAAAAPSPTPLASSIEEDPFLASFGEELVSLPEYKAPGTSKLDFDGLLAHRPLELHEDLKGGCGGQLWPAGMVLSRYLLRKYRDSDGLVGKSIVELGAGGGLVGLAVALGCRLHHGEGSETVNEKPEYYATKTQTRPLYITDQLPMFDLMLQNTALNGLEACVKPVIFDWGAAPPAEIPLPPAVILAADCVYFEPAFPLLLQTLEDLVGENTVCWFCFKKRRRADMHFVRDLKKRFCVERVEDDPDKEVYGRENIFLLKVTKKRAGAA